MIKLRISDDELEQELDRYQSSSVSARTVRGTIESAGIEAPAVTVEELAGVIEAQRNHGTQWRNDEIARAVLELMQRRTVPAAPGSQWVDLARVTDADWSRRSPIVPRASQETQEEHGARAGKAWRAWLIEKCGGAR